MSIDIERYPHDEGCSALVCGSSHDSWELTYPHECNCSRATRSMTINERIAKAKGWKNLMCPKEDWQHNITDAWTLVDEIRQTGLDAFILTSAVPSVEDGIYWLAHFGGPDSQVDEAGDTACEAICLAWLAVNEKEGV